VQAEDFGEHLLARLVDVAVDQILQAAGFAFQEDQELVGFAHPADVVPGAAEHVGAVPDQRRENHGDGRVESGDQQQAPPDRQRPHEALGFQVKAPPRPRAARGRRFILEGNQIEAH
jgi:hypothetical protein